jgi:tetratricopeptide (TPR) repeat protein
MNRYLALATLLLFGCTNFKKNKKNYQQALVEMEEGNNHKAILILEEYLKQKFDPQAAALQASLLFAENNYTEGVKILKKALKYTKNSNLKYDILNNLACGLMILQNTKEAINIWRNLSQEKLYATPEIAYFNLGFHEFRSQNLEHACQYFANCLALQPQYYDARWYLSLCYFYLNDFQKAQKQLEILHNHLPENTTVLNFQNQINKLCQ